jgi:transketolase
MFLSTPIVENSSPLVKFILVNAGLNVGADGGSHQALEDIALTRVLSRMTVISPCDAIEAKKAVVAAAKITGPVYMRLSRDKTPVMMSEETPFEIGKAQIVWRANEADGADTNIAQVGIIATGPILHKAIVAAKELESEGVAVSVMNLATIKPLDTNAVLEFAKNVGAIVTVEEHQIAGGMGSAVAECLSQNNPVPMEFVGVTDQFGQSGTPAELLEHYGMGVSHIKTAVKKVLSRKSSAKSSAVYLGNSEMSSLL